MKYLNKIIFAILFCPAFLTAQDCKPTVTIKTENRDFLIFVDDQYKGNGDIKLELDKGIHKIKIKEPGLKWDARSLQKEVTINDCNKTYNFDFNFDEEFLLETKPLDVSVYSNDTLIGNTPLLISKNIETIKLEKKDYQTIILNVSELSLIDPVKLDFTGEKKIRNFTDTPYFKILIGSALGLGAMAAYYKIQADQSFTKYEETNQKKYLDETDKYDNVSAIAFGALQINFGALIYFLLSDQ